MHPLKLTTLLSVILCAVACAGSESVSGGKLAVKSTADITNYNITVGCEVLDRDYTDYEAYKEYLSQLGIRKIRLQAGWAKTEKVKGVYDFAWLDKIIDDACGRGLEIWLQTSYGNPVYPGGGTENLGGGIPVSEEAKAAWNRWVEAMATRYLGKVHEWEIWNEPDLSGNITPEEVAELNIRTAGIIKRVDPDARIAGLALCVLRPDYLERCLRVIVDQDKLGLFDWISYHGYAYRPEDAYDNVGKARAVFDKFGISIALRQGENGAPSKGHMGGALDDYDWTPESQAKWDLRRLAGDYGHDVETSVFSIIDMAYPPAENQFVGKLNVKGLLASDYTKKVLGVKPAFYAVQRFATIADCIDIRRDEGKIKINGLVGEESCSAYLYADKRGGNLLMVWNSSATPVAEFEAVPTDMAIEGFTFKHPVLVDLLTGDVTRLGRGVVRSKGGNTAIIGLPVSDYPAVVMEDYNL